MEKVIESRKCFRGVTLCRECENGKKTSWSFVLPNKLHIKVKDSEPIKIKFYAKEIELKIGDIIHYYEGQPFRVIGFTDLEILVEEVNE